MSRVDDREGFVLIEDGEEVGFVECDKVGSNRETVERGLVAKFEGRVLVVDTRGRSL